MKLKSDWWLVSPLGLWAIVILLKAFGLVPWGWLDVVLRPLAAIVAGFCGSFLFGRILHRKKVVD